MWLDAVDLRDFYASPLGEAARRSIARRLREMWPDVAGLSVLGLGFATPYLDEFRGEAGRLVAAMPASQGVLHWPAEAPGQTVLADEAELPIADLSVDRIVLAHAVECVEQTRPMMREVWRVLAGGGRLVVIVPNRRGIWARLERTPFGFGRPYTPAQLTRLLRETLFTPVTTAAALYVPPGRSRFLLSSAAAWENIGPRWFKAVGGVIMIEAIKEIYAPTPTAQTARRRSYIIVPNQ